MKIQRLKKAGRSRRSIARELGLDKKTVRKYYDMSDKDFRDNQAEAMYRDKVFDTYKDRILEVYKINNNQRIHVSALYDYLEEQNGTLPGTEKTLRNYVRYLVQTGTLEFSERVRQYIKVPELPPGKQLQLDFGQYRLPSGKVLYICATVLSLSRFKFAVFQGRPFTTKDVIDHLITCFEYIGGCPEELVIDQDHLLVVSENRGDILYTKDFGYFINEMDLKMYVCRKADPETKGKIENVIKFIKYNFLKPRDFDTVDDANHSLQKWLVRRANGKICRATGQLPSVLIEQEREQLRPIRNSIFCKESLAGREIRLVNDKGQISVQASLYALPLKYRNRRVEIYITPSKLFIYDEYDGAEIADYDLSPVPGRTISKRAFKRHTERTAGNLKQEVQELFTDELWKKFTIENFKQFPRYTRDQCIDALKYFSGDDIVPDILMAAIQYCLENKTLSFANLNDTYRHFIHTKNTDRIVNNHPVVVSTGKTVKGSQSVPVAERSVHFYEDVIRTQEAV